MTRAASCAGALAHQSGKAAEGSVARYYSDRGLQMVARRWRGTAGEIDLILRDGADLIFVEVKKSRSFAQAALRVGPRQVARLLAAASEYLAGEPAGLDTPMRFDVALVNAVGEVDVIENALAA